MLGLLRGQVAVTIEGVDAFAAWAAGDPAAARDACATPSTAATPPSASCSSALRAAFVTPLEPEDVFALSRGIDWILDYARDLVNESEVMACPPDARIAEMAGAARRGPAAASTRRSPASAPTRTRRPRPPTPRSQTARRLEHAYYQGMAALLEVTDRNERIARRELYRRCSRLGEMVVDVAERVVYAVMKQS